MTCADAAPAGLALAVLAVPLGSAPAVAQPRGRSRRPRGSGMVGERFDGYLGFAAPPSRALRAQVEAINIRRRSLYSSLAAAVGVGRRTSASPPAAN